MVRVNLFCPQQISRQIADNHLEKLIIKLNTLLEEHLSISTEPIQGVRSHGMNPSPAPSLRQQQLHELSSLNDHEELILGAHPLSKKKDSSHKGQ